MHVFVAFKVNMLFSVSEGSAFKSGGTILERLKLPKIVPSVVFMRTCGMIEPCGLIVVDNDVHVHRNIHT